MKKPFFRNALTIHLAIVLAALVLSSAVPGQPPDTYTADRQRAVSLVNNGKYEEALPLLEKLSADKRADADVFLGLGLSYFKAALGIDDPAQAKPLRLKARNALVKARELGISIPEIDLLIASIKPDGGDPSRSDNPQARESMSAADKYFAAGDYQNAVKAYEKAATLDPTIYEAALYTGNTYYALKDYEKAGVWFAKAIAIDPDRETAHRYWADGLANSGRDKEAIDKYLDAILAEPYSSAAWRGLMQYASANNIALAHAKIDVPVDFKKGEQGNTQITLGSGSLDGKDDGSFAWMSYGITRATWQTDKDGKLSDQFKKAYPNERAYRHSLAEEAAALRMVATLAREKKVKEPSPALAMLQRIETAGLLEAFILFARSDAEVRRDYPAYRSANRDKLRLYLTEYVKKNGGK